MKRYIVIAALVVLAYFGWRTYQAGQQSTAPQGVTTSSSSPSGNVNADVCIGSKDFCKGVADAKQLELENAQKQFEQQLAAQAPQPTPTLTPDEIARQGREQDAKTNVLIVAFWAAVVIGIIYLLAWLVWQIYWHFRIKAPRDEQAADIRTSKDGKLVVARLPGNPDFANSADQWIALDQNARGAQLIHIDSSGIAHQLKLTDDAAKYVAIANALSDAARTSAGHDFMMDLLKQWSHGTNQTIKTLGDAASQWRGARSRTPVQHVPSKMRRLERGETEAPASQSTEKKEPESNWKK